MEKSIEETKEIINKQIDSNTIKVFGESFSKYQKVYFSTNENIQEYLKLIDINNTNNALTVLASGDHLFNLLTNNVLNVDTFDTNNLTKYYVFGLKMSLILKYNYKEYLNILKKLISEFTSFDEINNILFDLLPYMDNEYKKYWEEILNYNYNIQKNNKYKLNLINMLFINLNDVSKYNNYLLEEKNYNILKNNFNKSNITFKNINAINLKENYNNKYDVILLSNILDYFYKTYGFNWDINILNNYINNLHTITNANGIIFVNYIYNYSVNNFTKKNELIHFSNISKEDLIDYEINKLNKNKIVKDGIILSKKHYKRY